MADHVLVNNPGKGAHILPVIGTLKPGWNEVPRNLYVKAPVAWKTLPFTVRDPDKKEGPKDISVEDAVAMALDTNDAKTLKKLKDGEKRKAVLNAISRQERVLTIEKLDLEGLEALLEEEDRPNVRASIEKAIKAASQ